jgi:hypothetical protein
VGGAFPRQGARAFSSPAREITSENGRGYGKEGDLFHERDYTAGFIFRGVWALCISERSFWLFFIVDPERFATLPLGEKMEIIPPRVRGITSFPGLTVAVRKLSSVPKKVLFFWRRIGLFGDLYFRWRIGLFGDLCFRRRIGLFGNLCFRWRRKFL